MTVVAGQPIAQANPLRQAWSARPDTLYILSVRADQAVPCGQLSSNASLHRRPSCPTQYQMNVHSSLQHRLLKLKQRRLSSWRKRRKSSRKPKPFLGN